MSQLVLSLQNVTIYQENKVILSQVNLEVNHGEFIYIIGKTGSGKSSLLDSYEAKYSNKKFLHIFLKFQTLQNHFPHSAFLWIRFYGLC